MTQLTVKKSGLVIPVATDEHGRPQCFCGSCSGVMTEVAPNEWRCEHAVAVDARMREVAARIAEQMEAS
ncbi:MAG: hypothetical protein IRZ07_03510 [Microbispora sp.]|nr:hypothetical protein [Microbispora sp.]